MGETSNVTGTSIVVTESLVQVTKSALQVMGPHYHPIFLLVQAPSSV